jgi:hypothetical protein
MRFAVLNHDKVQLIVTISLSPSAVAWAHRVIPSSDSY